MAISVRRVSIPQAVSTVTTSQCKGATKSILMGFNTVNGKYCCNLSMSVLFMVAIMDIVSIPQAVSTVATWSNHTPNHSRRKSVSIPQAVSTVATAVFSHRIERSVQFQYRKR